MLSRRTRSISLAAVTSAATVVQWSSCTPTIPISQTVRPLHWAIDLSLSMACVAPTPHRQAGKQHEPRTRSSYRAGDSDAVGMRRAVLARFPRRARRSVSPTVGNPAGVGSHLRGPVCDLLVNGRRGRHFDAVMPEHMARQIIALECTISLRLVILIFSSYPGHLII